ncbi:envelope glycoprotein [Parasponia andersonii]|uniref:Envelope glycoprotein n=1 Tax=Parasponia andersonii TaxID=3476 RepID=A0A2P5B4U0_PARAD|nr:envelope glycoprotein [Parasponia andersonii]
MVLWEITLGTAYFLGLKRTYRLALKIQRRLVSPKHPKIRQFVRRRTRAVFDVALKVHYNIQQRDIEVGRNLGNWILRWLDRMKPSAQIRGPPEKPSPGASTSLSMTKQETNSNHLKTPGNIQTSRNRDSDRHLFTAYKNVLPKPFASITMMRVTQYRQLCVKVPGGLRSNYNKGGFEGVIRKDIMQWMHQN